MIHRLAWPTRSGWAALLPGMALAALIGFTPARAQTFPDIPIWSFAGAPQAGADSVAERGRTITVKFVRDPAAEARSDFGGYRIYRVYNALDSTKMVLVRRFSRQDTDTLFLWHFPFPISPSTPVEQRTISFVDPDSSGSFQKKCRHYDQFGRCITPGDSVLVLVAPPGPHNGFLAWYSVTYEEKNLSDNNYKDLYVRDPSCTNPDTALCANLNNKLRNVTGPVSATPGPTENLQTVSVVPNPFRGAEAWDVQGGHEVHFINLPSVARIRVYTVAGDLIRDLQHNDPVHDYERWDLKNGKGEDVSSGIYVFRVETDAFQHQGRFIVIR